jgi:pimeloyl-ACP methyl ester carboxylesterase
MIAQKLLGQDCAVAAVAIDAAQIKGVLPLPLSALRVTFPVFKNPANAHRAVSLTAEQFRYAFGNALTEAESDELYDRWSIPAPGKPLFEAAAANFNPHSPAAVATDNEMRGPLLLMTGGKDHTVPESITRSTLKQYRHSDAVTDFHEFVDRGHSLTMDSGWREVADVALDWLGRQSLGDRPVAAATGMP